MNMHIIIFSPGPICIPVLKTTLYKQNQHMFDLRGNHIHFNDSEASDSSDAYMYIYSSEMEFH